jgi:hypothetical protein
LHVTDVPEAQLTGKLKDPLPGKSTDPSANPLQVT